MTKKALKLVRDSQPRPAKEFCSACKKNTMELKDANYIGLEVWECAHCKNVERHPRADREKVLSELRSKAGEIGTEEKGETDMSKGAAESLKKLRENGAAAKPSVEAKKEKQADKNEQADKVAYRAFAERKKELDALATKAEATGQHGAVSLFQGEAKRLETSKQPELPAETKSKMKATNKSKTTKKTGSRAKAEYKRVVAKGQRSPVEEKKTIKTPHGVRRVLTEDQAREFITKVVKEEPEISPTRAIAALQAANLSFGWPKFKAVFFPIQKKFSKKS